MNNTANSIKVATVCTVARTFACKFPVCPRCCFKEIAPSLEVKRQLCSLSCIGRRLCRKKVAIETHFRDPYLGSPKKFPIKKQLNEKVALLALMKILAKGSTTSYPGSLPTPGAAEKTLVGAGHVTL